MEILTKYALEIFFGLVSAGLLAFCKYLFTQNKELKKYQEADRNRQNRQMILDEIEPIIDEITRLKNEINQIESRGKDKLEEMEQVSSDEHVKMYKDLEETHAETLKALELIINSYKFRLIQLCKTHIRDGYITEDDFEQVSEMYKLYHGLGGNGQAQEYYDKVLKLETKPNNY